MQEELNQAVNTEFAEAIERVESDLSVLFGSIQHEVFVIVWDKV